MRYDIVVVGCSLGGLKAVQALLTDLPKAFPLPIVIVQHRGKTSGDGLSKLLQSVTPLPVCEAEDKQQIAPGWVYLAPADYHLLVGAGEFMLSTEAPVNHARPSVDVLFESAAAAYGASVIGVVLTGAGADGAQGAAAIKRRGGLMVVQDPASAEAAAMPEAVVASGCDHILPLLDIPPLLARLASKSRGGQHAIPIASQRPARG